MPRSSCSPRRRSIGWRTRAAALERVIADAIASTRAPFRVSRAGSLLYLEFAPPETPDGAVVGAVVRKRLPAAWLSHGLLGSAINASTVMTDEQIDEIGRRFRAAMAELMEFAGEFLGESGSADAADAGAVVAAGAR